MKRQFLVLAMLVGCSNNGGSAKSGSSKGEGLNTGSPGLGMGSGPSNGQGGDPGVGRDKGGEGPMDDIGRMLQLGEPTAAGEIDKTTVRKVVRQNLAKLQYCYEKTLLANPGIEGNVTVKFTIGIEGSVIDATATGVHPDVESCVVQQVRTFKFPRPTAGTVEVSYPFAFKPA